MTVEAELLAAIRAAPRDDAPRLVYADWLLGRGDRRGELIVLQCEQARTPWYTPRWVELERRLDQLAGIERRYHPEIGIELRRGMIEGVQADDLAQLERLREVLFGEGLVHRASLRFDHPARWRDLAHIDELALAHIFADRARLAPLAEHPRLRLRRLDLDECLTADGLDVLEQGGFADLEALRIRGQRWDDGTFDFDVVCDLLAARAATLTRLRWLALQPRTFPDGVGAEGCAALGALALEQLWLDGSVIGDDGAAVLAGAASSARLRGLSLRAAGIGDRGAAALAGSPHLRGLAWLDLSENPLGPEGHALLDASEALAGAAIFVDPPPAAPSRLRRLEASQRDPARFDFPEHA